jgi:hypothetical protein
MVACSTVRPVPAWRGQSTGAAGSGLRVGDEVTLSTRSTGQIQMVIGTVEVNAVVGVAIGHDSATPARVLFEDILAVERREVDGLKTTLLVVGLLLLVVMVALKNAAFFPSAAQ